MIWFFTPYSFNAKLFDAYNSYMQLVKDDEDWVCMSDGDAFFFQSNFGHLIQDYIDAYPDTGIFTAYANRIGNHHQLLSPRLKEVDSIRYHYKIANSQQMNCHKQTTIIPSIISGFIMVIKKGTWNRIRDEVKKACEDLQQLKVDNEISRAVMNAGLNIRRMDGIYILHYYRMVEGKIKRGIE